MQFGPIGSQQLQLFTQNRLGANETAASARFWLRVMSRIFMPLSALYFLYMYLCIPGVPIPLLAAAALAVGAFLSLPSLNPAYLSPLVGAFLVPCYAFSFPVNLYRVIGAQALFFVVTKFT